MMKCSLVVISVLIISCAGCRSAKTPEWNPSETSVTYVYDTSIPEETRAALVHDIGGLVEQGQLRSFTRISRYGTELRKAAILHIEDRKMVERFANELGDPINPVAVMRLSEMDSDKKRNITASMDVLGIVLDDVLPYEMRVHLMKELAPFYTQEQLLLLAHVKHHDELRQIAIEHLEDRAYLSEVAENAQDDLSAVAADRLMNLNGK